MKLMRTTALGAALVMMTVAAAACGGGDDDGGDDGDEATPPAATATRPESTATRAVTPTEEVDTPQPSSPTAAATSAPPTSVPPTAAPTVDSLTVSAGDFAFSPNAISVIGANDTNITLNNTGSAPHTMKVYRDAAFTDAVPLAETQQIAGGASDGFTLTSANIGGATQLFFRCEVHPSQMQGTIAVQ